MPLQNRVDPFSKIHAAPMRGLFTGNRGILHDAATRTLKKQTWATEGWVICQLKWKDWQAPIMGQSHWTELFFLDEAVALAAGHRPCYVCRKAEAKAFRDAAGVGKVSDLNHAINSEMKPYLRMRSPVSRRACRPADLPDGAMFAVGTDCFLKLFGKARPFSWRGYGAPIDLPEHATRLTPNATITALRNGYSPVLHPSAYA